MIKQCKRCKHGHPVAVPVEPAQKVEEKWKCDKEHKIKNPHEINDCKDFEEKPV